MGKAKPPYPPEFRQQMIDSVQSGMTSAELSRELGVSGQTIANWITRFSIDNAKLLAGKDGMSRAEKQELARLRRKNRQLRTERGTLAKATVRLAARKDGTPTPSTSS